MKHEPEVVNVSGSEIFYDDVKKELRHHLGIHNSIPIRKEVKAEKQPPYVLCNHKRFQNLFGYEIIL